MEVNGGHDVNLNSGVISGLGYSTVYHVYYDDPTYQGGAVTYFCNTTQAVALNATGRFYVGSIKTPVPGGVTTIGNNDGGTGAQSGELEWLSPTLRADLDAVSGAALWSPAFADDTDGDTSTVAGFSGIDGNGFDTSQLNGTFYCIGSSTTQVQLEMFIPLGTEISGFPSGPTLTVDSLVTVDGFFINGWAPPSVPINGGGVAGFWLADWEQPMFLAVQSPYATFVIAPLYPDEGQIFPTGQVNDADYIVVSVKN